MIQLRSIFAAVLVVLGAAPHAGATDIVVLKSKSLPAYNDSVVAFKTNCGAKYTEFDMDLDEDRGAAFVEQINAEKPNLVFAVGKQAARAARAGVDKGIPVVFA